MDCLINLLPQSKMHIVSDPTVQHGISGVRQDRFNLFVRDGGNQNDSQRIGIGVSKKTE